MSEQRQHDKRRKPEPEEFRLKIKSKTATNHSANQKFKVFLI